MLRRLKTLICEMLTEPTGTHMCDSGGSNGRMWQRNKGLTVEALEERDAASLEISHSEKFGWEFEATIDLYHFLKERLCLDDFCEEFNELPVEDWEGDGYGLSKAGQEWLEARDFELLESHNTYNWESNLSQVIQYTEVRNLNTPGEEYILLQVHGGADVRGGYTDAKLFLKDCEYFPYEGCSFGVFKSVPGLPEIPPPGIPGLPEPYAGEWLNLSYSGEWINNEGSSANDDDFAEFGEAALTEGTSVTIAGDLYEA